MKRFRKAYIEITNVCNLNCEFCPKTKRPARFMKLAEFERAADALLPYTDYVYLHLMGEPLLHPELYEMLEVCAARGLRVNITTNGTLLGAPHERFGTVGEMLLRSGAVRKTAFSLHSFEANVAKEPLEAYIGRIMQFIAPARAAGMLCELRLWNGSGAETFNERIVALIMNALGKSPPQSGTVAGQTSPQGGGDSGQPPQSGAVAGQAGQNLPQGGGDSGQPPQSGAVAGQAGQSPPQSGTVAGQAGQTSPQSGAGAGLRGAEKLGERLYLARADRFDWPDAELDELGSEVFCFGLRDQIGVLADGTVVPCCLDSDGTVALGNIFTEPLAEIICGERAKKIYDGFSARHAVEPLCRRCGYARRF